MFIGARAYIIILAHPIESIRGTPYILNDKQGNLFLNCENMLT